MIEYRDFENTSTYLDTMGMGIHNRRLRIKIPEAKEVLKRGIIYFCGKSDISWVEGYDKIAEWLADNNGRGLLLMGGCGLGKSIITTKVLPVLFKHYYDKILSVYYADRINKTYTEAETRKLVVIDDIGVEGEANTFGDKRMVMKEVVDYAERTGQLLILSTNLTAEELEQKYDVRTMDRLRAITKCIVLDGESNRH